MTIRHDPWPAGCPAWADLMVPDRHVAREFYSALFGWEFTEGTPETGYYMMALKDGEPVVGIGEPLPGQEGSPSQWTVYLASDDVAADVETAAANGATVLAPAMDVMAFGKMAVIADPTGAVAGLWQSGTHTGANVVAEPGTLVWTEQMSRDLEAATSFFATLFGYTYTDMSAPGGMQYVTFEIDGVTSGGLGEITPEMGDAQPHWLAYFGVEDTDDAAATITEHGGTVLKPAWDTPFGRIAIVAGAVGEVFAIIRMAEQPEDA